MKTIVCSMVAVFATFAGALVCADEPSKAATAELPAALQMAGVSQDSVVSSAAAHKVRGQLFLGDAFDFSQTKSFDIAGTLTKGTTDLLEGFSGTYQYSVAEQANGKTISLTVNGQFAGLGGGIGVNNDSSIMSTFGSLNFVIGGKMLSESLEFQNSQFTQHFQQVFQHLLAPPAP